MTRIAAARALPADPAPSDNPRVALGDNRPPIHAMAVADFNEAIDKREGLRKRITDVVASAGRASVTDKETAGRAGELVRQLDAVQKAVDEERTAVKRPYLEAGRNIDDAAKTLIADAAAAETSVRGMLTGYMREEQRKQDEAERTRRAEEQRQRDEQQRREAEERERAAAENREPEPVPEPVLYTPPPAEPEKVQVRSDFGAVASARKVKVATITDWRKAFRAVENVAAVREAVQKAVNGLMRAGQTNIPGVEIGEDVGLSVR